MIKFVFGLVPFAIVLLQISPTDGQGATRDICSGSLNANNDKWGYLVSHGWPSDYPTNVGCWFYLYLDSPQTERIHFQNLIWTLDRSSYNDRLTMQILQENQWYQVIDFYFHSDISWISRYINYGSIRFYWYSDPYNYYSPRRFQFTWTYQKYVFGCELLPQPQMFTNHSTHGVIKSPFFPSVYPVNSFCETVIDVDNARDTVEFTPVMFNLGQNDFLRLYIGNAATNDWIEYMAFSMSTVPTGSFSIYGSDVKTIFTSDYMACGNGYLMYWRVMKKESYAIYKSNLLMGFWPLTAAHRGNDIINDCNAVEYPPSSGLLSTSFGPSGLGSTGLVLTETALKMTSDTCKSTTHAEDITFSLFAKTTKTTSMPLIEWANADAALTNGLYGVHFWLNNPSNQQLWTNTNFSIMQASSIQTNKWQFYSNTIDKTRQRVSLRRDLQTIASNTFSSSASTGTYGGFTLGSRETTTDRMKGHVSCLTMYQAALREDDLTRIKTMCEKIQEQYAIYKPPGSPLGWWPLNGIHGFRDISGNGLHGEAVDPSLVTLTTGPNGAANTAYSFTGNVNSKIFFNHPETNLAYESFTISMYLFSTNTGIDKAFLSYAFNGARGLHFHMYDRWDQIWTNLYDSTHMWGNCCFKTDTWRFFSFVYDTSDATYNYFHVWVDGALQYTRTIAKTYFVATDKSGFYLGGSPPGISTAWIGKIACLSIYKSALHGSDKQAQLMTACNEDMNQPVGQLMGFWPLTGLTGLKDISGHEMHGVAMSDEVVLTTGPFGVPNTAYLIGENTTAYIKVDHPDAKLRKQSFTISFFAMPTDTNQAPIIEYLSDPTVATYGTKVWSNFPGPGEVHFNSGFSGSPSMQTNGFVPTNTWMFYSAVYDAVNGFQRIYRDGALIASVSAAKHAWKGNTTQFLIGHRNGTGYLFKGKISCLSIYQTALSVGEIGKVKSMCHNYLLHTSLQVQESVKDLSVDCDFDNGFCGWTQGVDDDSVNWVLGHDETPSGKKNYFYTGPRQGVSKDQAEDLDQYAFISSVRNGIKNKAKLMSPAIGAGWHCFQFWYHMSGKPEELSVQLMTSNVIPFKANGNQAHQWHFVAFPFYVPAGSHEQIVIEGISGASNFLSDIAIDSLKLTQGKCSSAARCPQGWLSSESKCFFNFTNSDWLVDRATAVKTCQMLKGRIAVPSTSEELNIMRSFGSAVHVGVTLSASQWADIFKKPFQVNPWKISARGGLYTALAVDSVGYYDYIPDTATKFMTVCEIFKVEAPHVSFNCTFDDKHLCGWKNALDDNSDDYNPNSMDMDTSSGIALPWYNDYYHNGPLWDFTKGNTRGSYLLMQDLSGSCGNYLEIQSPLVYGNGNYHCFQARFYRWGYSYNYPTVYIQRWTADQAVLEDVTDWGSHSTNMGPHWSTLSFDTKQKGVFRILIRVQSTCSGWGNIAFDDMEISQKTCPMVLNAKSLTGRSVVDYFMSIDPDTYIKAQDTLVDFSMRGISQYMTHRNVYGDDNTDWTRLTFSRNNDWILNGPQNDYDGENYYLHLAQQKVSSLRSIAQWTGPSIPSGSRCLIFHYFQYGSDVGEMRLRSGSRVLWSTQGSKSPAWKRHRMLFNEKNQTPWIFEGTSGLQLGSDHLQKFESQQLDAMWLRNGTDLCLGYMDCDFEQSIDNCGWYQNDTDDADWFRNSGETPSGNGVTGPGSDHTSGQGSYLYFRGSSFVPGSNARIHMPTLPQGKFCLTFYYHMFGEDIGNLRVFYNPMESLAAGNGDFPPLKVVEVWSKNGNQGNAWKMAMVQLDLSYPQFMTFEASRGLNGGDIAIDDVVVLKGECPSQRGLSCSFEFGDFCDWRSENFLIGKGKTENSPMGGPEGDVNGLYAGGKFAYLNGKTVSPGGIAKLTSPTLPSGTFCFKMSYNMRGRQTGGLSIYQGSVVVSKVRGANTGYEWRNLMIDLSSNQPFSIIIQATQGQSPMTDIAIDDLIISEGPCFNRNESGPGAVGKYSEQYNSLELLNHQISAPMKAVVLASCIQLCRSNENCKGVNYFSSTKMCQLNNATANEDPYNLQSNPLSTNVAMKTKISISEAICTQGDLTCGEFSSTNCLPTAVSSISVCQCQNKGRSCYLLRDCQALAELSLWKLQLSLPASGIYTIQPNANNGQSIQVKCQLDATTSKYQTVLLNRFNGGLRFHRRTLNEYSQYFGSPDGEYWIGLDNMHHLTMTRNYGYIIEASHQGVDFTPISGLTSPFRIGNSTENYAVKSATVTGSMIDSSWGAGGVSFSTIDSASSNECVQLKGLGGWWYNGSGCSEGILTGPYRPGEPMASSKDGFFSNDFNSGVGLSAVRLKVVPI